MSVFSRAGRGYWRAGSLLALVYFLSGPPAPTEAQPDQTVPGPPLPPLAWQPPLLKDSFGDPLPAGAILRLGTTRLRHNEHVDTVGFSPDGKVLAVGGGDQPVRLWNPQTGKQMGQLSFPGNEAISILTLAFSPDGQWLATCGSKENEPQLTLWDWKKNTVRWKKKDKEFYRASLAFSPDGKFLATGFGSKMRVWDTAAGDQKFEFADEKKLANDHTPVTFSSDGNRLALGNGPTIYVWNWPEGKIIQKITSDATGETSTEKRITGLALLPKTNTIVTSEYSYGAKKSPSINRVCFWEITTGKKLQTIPLEERIRSIAVTKDGKNMAIILPGIVKLWDLEKNKLEKEWEKSVDYLSNWPNDLAFSPDGSQLAFAGQAFGIFLWNVSQGKFVIEPSSHMGTVHAVRFSPDGTTLATGGRDGFLLLIDAKTGVEKHRLFLGTEAIPGKPGELILSPKHAEVRNFEFSPDGSLIAATGWHLVPATGWHHTMEGLWRVWKVKTGQLSKAGALPEPGGAIVFSPHGKALAVSYGFSGPETDRPDFNLILELASGKQIHKFPTKGLVPSLRFSPDGKKFWASSEFGARLWDLASGKEEKKIGPLDQKPLFSLVYFSDSRVAFTNWSKPTSISFADLQSGTVWNQLEIPTKDDHLLSYQIAVAPDDRLLVAAAYGFGENGADLDDSLHLIEVATGRILATLHGGKTRTAALAFAPDSKRFVSGMRNGTALVWDIGPIPSVTKPTPKEVQRWWDEMASAKTEQAFLALRFLASTPEQSLPILAQQLQAKPALSPEQIEKYIADLNSPNFPLRQKAVKELEQLGSHAYPAMLEALKKPSSLEQQQRLEKLIDLGPVVQQPKIIQRLRAIQALEWIGNVEAKQLLANLAKGHPALLETKDAEKSLHRLHKALFP